MKAINITAYTDDASQIEAIKALFKAFKIKYTISKVTEEEVSYNPEFVEKILKGDEDLKAGKGVKMSLEDLEKLCK